MKNYPQIKVPIDMNQDLSLITNDDVKKYFDWFLNIKEDRIKIFCNKVFEPTYADLSIDNLPQIFNFLEKNIFVRMLTQEEIEEKRDKLPEHIKAIHKFDNYELIEPTYSIIFDSGIYFGELLRKEILGLEWRAETNKRMVYFGKPVLEKDGIKASLEPAAIICVLVNQIYKKTADFNRLMHLYTTWKNIFEGKSIDYSEIGRKEKK